MSADHGLTEPTAAEPAAKDNLLGICHAIGEDFGFNPLFLRIPLAIGIIFSASWTLAAYAAMGIAVLASRLVVRAPRRQPVAPALVEPRPAQYDPQPAGDLALAA